MGEAECFLGNINAKPGAELIAFLRETRPGDASNHVQVYIPTDLTKTDAGEVQTWHESFSRLNDRCMVGNINDQDNDEVKRVDLVAFSSTKVDAQKNEDRLTIALSIADRFTDTLTSQGTFCPDNDICRLADDSVQIAYCVDCAGNLRIFVEHWHGNAAANSTSMTIGLAVGTVTTTQTASPLANLQNIPMSQLPGCATPILSVAGCTGQMNTYNDWVYFDYTGLPAGVPISFTILSGSNVFTADGCNMFPLTVTFTIPLPTTR